MKCFVLPVILLWLKKMSNVIDNLLIPEMPQPQTKIQILRNYKCINSFLKKFVIFSLKVWYQSLENSDQKLNVEQY